MCVCGKKGTPGTLKKKKKMKRLDGILSLHLKDQSLNFKIRSDLFRNQQFRFETS